MNEILETETEMTKTKKYPYRDAGGRQREREAQANKAHLPSKEDALFDLSSARDGARLSARD